jgi:presenilin-like A22 family membrane protease
MAYRVATLVLSVALIVVMIATRTWLTILEGTHVFAVDVASIIGVLIPPVLAGLIVYAIKSRFGSRSRGARRGVARVSCRHRRAGR